MKKVILVSMVLVFCLSVSFGQEVMQGTSELKPDPQAIEKVQAWQLPAHMQEALMSVLNQKVAEFKAFLIANVKGFEKMPNNVVFDFTSGVFLTPESVLKLQEQQKKIPVKK